MTALGRGVRVKCINKGAWGDAAWGPARGPEFGSIWVIKKLIRSYFEYRGPWLELENWPDGSWFHADYFVPLKGNEDLTELEAAARKGKAEAEKLPRVRVVEKVR